MTLSIGQTLQGPRGIYKLTDLLKAPAVFKAKVLSSSSIKDQTVVVKTCTTANERLTLNREYTLFSNPSIASSPHFRACHDFIGWTSSDDVPKSLVLEWMDHDLRSIPYQMFRERPSLVKAVAKATLSALQLLHEEFQAIHSDVSPNNVFVKDLEDASIAAKVGDLGNVVKQGYNKYRIQSLQTRAPEVWLGLGCWHSSDVWSVGVTLVHCLVPQTIFGPRDKIVQDLTSAWCIAKIARLVGPIPQRLAKEEYYEDFLLAGEFAFNTFDHPDTGQVSPYINVGTIRDELKKATGPVLPNELIDFIESLLVVDHTKRPTAREALDHPFLRDH